MRKIRSKEIAMIFQDPISALNPLQKIGDQLLEAVFLHQRLKKEEAMDLAIGRWEMWGFPGRRSASRTFPTSTAGGCSSAL